MSTSRLLIVEDGYTPEPEEPFVPDPEEPEEPQEPIPEEPDGEDGTGGGGNDPQPFHKVIIDPSQPVAGDSVKIIVYTVHQANIECIDIQSGNKMAGFGGTDTIKELVTVTPSSSIQTGFPIVELDTDNVSLSDREGGTRTYSVSSDSEGNVVSDATGYGVVLLSYKTEFMRFITPVLSPGTYFYQPLCIYDGDLETVVIKIEEPDEESTGSSAATEVRYIDVSTGQPISGASAYIDGRLIGTTNSDGVVNAGVLAGGQHSVRATAPGYIPTDQDDLQNDSFTL